MQIAIVVLVVFAAIDLLAVASLIAVVFVEHRRQRRIAQAAGAPIPPLALGQFAILAAVGLAGIAFLYAVGVFLLDE